MKTPRPGSVLICLFAGCLCSCSVIRTYQTTDATHTGAGSGNAFAHDTVIRTSLWKGKNNLDVACDCENGISRFKVTTRPGDVLLGTVTLGLRVRQRVEWDCAQRSSASDPD